MLSWANSPRSTFPGRTCRGVVGEADRGKSARTKPAPRWGAQKGLQKSNGRLCPRAKAVESGEGDSITRRGSDFERPWRLQGSCHGGGHMERSRCKEEGLE